CARRARLRPPRRALAAAVRQRRALGTVRRAALARRDRRRRRTPEWPVGPRRGRARARVGDEAPGRRRGSGGGGVDVAAVRRAPTGRRRVLRLGRDFGGDGPVPGGGRGAPGARLLPRRGRLLPVPAGG